MTTGTIEDFKERLLAVLPQWFGENPIVLHDFLIGFATLDKYCYDIIEYVALQMVIQTSTDSNLDLEACDYFGKYLTRPEGMSDDIFKDLLLADLIAEMATLQGVKRIITALTGITPKIWEPFNSSGNAAYNIPIWGYNTSGAYGGNLPYHFWVEVFVKGNPMDKFGVYNNDTWAYNASGPTINGAYGSNRLFRYNLTYAQILALINRIKVGGTVPHLTVTYL